MARKLRKDIEAAVENTGGTTKEEVSKVEDFLECMAKYHKAFQDWEKRSDKILKRYRDESRGNRSNTDCRFNILWSNVQTLVPATFSKLPQPDVSRRFKDQDPVGRVAALILERGLDFEITHYTDYRSTLRQCVYDRFLGGRGTAWIRYEPHFKGVDSDGPDDGLQVTEDTDETPVDEALDYECAPIDYVHWKDFGHDVARTWEEVTRVWRNVYMGEDAVAKRFGAEVAKTLAYDASPDTNDRQDQAAKEVQKKQALIIELWDKQEGKAYWFSKSSKKMLDEKDDPLGLQDFFPCPRPLYSTLTNDTLVPVPDFTLYQDQAKELDILADRIDGLARMLQVKGVYDASVPELGRLFTEGANGDLIPGKNWAKFAEKMGLAGSLQLVDLKPIAEALKIAAETMEQVKGQVYEITGISDIIRGQTSASETATAQQIKGQYASLRLRSMQDEVSRFATDCLQMKAQVICGKFSVTTIAAISAADQLSGEDKPQVFTAAQAPQPIPGQPPAPPQPPQPTGPAMALLVGQERLVDPSADAPNPLRSFRIEVAADTLVQLDEQQEKQDRLEFVTAVGGYLEKAAPIIQMSPAAGPLIMTLMKFGIRGFKIGKQVEGQIDAAIEQLQQVAKAGPPPDPKVLQEQAMQQAKAQVAQENASKEVGLNKRAADLDIREMKFKAEQEIAKQKQDFQRTIDEQERSHADKNQELTRKQDEQSSKMMSERAAFDEERANAAREQAERVDTDSKSRDQGLQDLVQTIVQSTQETTRELAALAKAMNSPKRIVRSRDGRVQGVEAAG